MLLMAYSACSGWVLTVTDRYVPLRTVEALPRKPAHQPSVEGERTRCRALCSQLKSASSEAAGDSLSWPVNSVAFSSVSRRRTVG